MYNPALTRTAHVSNIITALLAAFGLIIAVWQIKASEAIQREASARDAYKEYLKLAIEKPDLADLSLPSTLPFEQRKAGHIDLLNFYLFSAEQVFETFSGDEGWQQSLRSDLCDFSVSLNGELKHWQWSQHESAFIEFAQDALAHCND
jgi:hypothetical protein